ncbi:MAG: hypothetical protein IKW83_09260 [Muribaculaceae bacterium]|nr:hypothetical protein [Muribaculaceae bacterium]
MSNNINNNDWLDALKQKAQNATREVPEGTWEAIAKSANKQAAPAKATRIAPQFWWRATAAAAVVAIVATMGFFLLRNDKQDSIDKLASNQPSNTPSVIEEPAISGSEQQLDITDEPLLAQDNSIEPQPSLPQEYVGAPKQDYGNVNNTLPQNVDKTGSIDDMLLANNTSELIDLADYPNEFDPENYYYDIETMLALEELYSQYDNVMNQDAMEPWKSYTDSTYQQYLVYDANARRVAREKMSLTKPRKKTSMLLAAYGNGLVSTDRNSIVSGSSAQMLLPPATTNPGMMMAPGAPGMTPNVAPPVNYDYHHHMPLTFGLTFTKRIVGNLYGNVGINFTTMSSDVTPDNGSGMFKQDIKLIGLPFGVRWNFWRYKGLTTFVGGEGMVERVVDASFGNDDVTIKRLQWSVHATAGAQYNFTKHVGIYIEPKLSHYITTLPLNTLRNEHPFNFNLQMGLSVDF